MPRAPLAAKPTSDSQTQRRAAIIATATRLFAEVGYAECTMEHVAEKLRIAKGTLYLYFPSKEELFYASVDAGMRELQQAIHAAVEAESEMLARIRAGIYAYLKFFDDHPDLAELIIQERASFKNRKRPTYFEHRDANRGAWRELYMSLMGQGVLRTDLPVDRMLDTVGNLLYGTMFTNHFLPRAVPLTDQFEALLEILMRGLLNEKTGK